MYFAIADHALGGISRITSQFFNDIVCLTVWRCALGSLVDLWMYAAHATQTYTCVYMFMKVDVMMPALLALVLCHDNMQRHVHHVVMASAVTRLAKSGLLEGGNNIMEVEYKAL
jgi:hypothetical protein